MTKISRYDKYQNSFESISHVEKNEHTMGAKELPICFTPNQNVQPFIGKQMEGWLECG